MYLSTLGGNASNSGDDIDYKPLDKSALTFAAYETVKTVTINTYSDSLAEGDEYFWLDLYKTYADAESGAYAAYASGGIKDPEEAAVDYDYTITSSAPVGSPVEEGSDIVFTITRSDSGTPSTVYILTSQSTAEYNTDYTPLSSTVNFAFNETVKTVTVSTLSDSESEGTEYFFISLFKTLGDRESGTYAAYSTGYIQDSANEVEYDYTVTSDANRNNPVEEGGTITFTITRSDAGTSSTVYLSTLLGRLPHRERTLIMSLSINTQ